MMWTKLYVGIIVVILLVFLSLVQYLVTYLDKQYQLKEYGLPINCFSQTICGLNGNIILLFVIYLLIPSEYFDKAIELLDPKKLQKSASEDALGIDIIANNIGQKINNVTGLKI